MGKKKRTGQLFIGLEYLILGSAFIIHLKKSEYIFKYDFDNKIDDLHH